MLNDRLTESFIWNVVLMVLIYLKPLSPVWKMIDQISEIDILRSNWKLGFYELKSGD